MSPFRLLTLEQVQNWANWLIDKDYITIFKNCPFEDWSNVYSIQYSVYNTITTHRYLKCTCSTCLKIYSYSLILRSLCLPVSLRALLPAKMFTINISSTNSIKRCIIGWVTLLSVIANQNKRCLFVVKLI